MSGRWRWGAALVAVAVVISARAAQAADGDAAQELAALVKESEASPLGHKEAYLAFSERFEKFAGAHAGSEEALTAKLWLLKGTWWHREDGTMEKLAAALADEILRDYPKSKQLAQVPDLYYDLAAADRDRICGQLLASSPHAEVRGAALLRLAASAAPPRRQELFERLRKEFADVAYRYTTLDVLAEAYLAPCDPAALAPGKPAPELEGKTPDGSLIRLSDLKGKVVVLDFFGDW